MAAVYTGTSGSASQKRSIPSGAASKQTNLIDQGLVDFSRSTAATPELPVANIGYTTSTSRLSTSWGTLK